MNRVEISPQDAPKARSLPLWIALCLSALSGALTSFSYLPLDWHMCVWFSLIPLCTALWSGAALPGRRGFFRALWIGLVYGVVSNSASFWWINEVSSLGFGPSMVYLACYATIWTVLMGTVLRPKLSAEPEYNKNRTVRLAAWKSWCFLDMAWTAKTAIAGAALWAVTEWLRNNGTFAFGWNGMATALYPTLSFAQWAEYVGTAGLSVLPVGVNIWLWFVGRRLGLMMMREGRRTVPWDFFALVTVLVMMFLWGLNQAQLYAPGSKIYTDSLPVASLQQNISQSQKWDPANKAAIYADLVSSTERCYDELAQRSMEKAQDEGVSVLDRPAWVVWPESSLPNPKYYLASSGALLFDAFNPAFFAPDGPLAKLRHDVGDFVLITGGDEIQLLGDYSVDKVQNVMIIDEGDYQAQRSHKKSHLVPFGEYIPAREYLGFLEAAFEMSAGFSMGNNVTPGTSIEPLFVPAVIGGEEMISVIPTICFEDTVPGLVRQFVRPGKQVIINVTNDGWFHQTCAGAQHARNAAMRAIELRRPMLRASNTGISIAYAPNGAIISQLQGEDHTPFVKGWNFARLPLYDGGYTLYALAGDWFIALCALIVCGFIFIRVWQKLSVKK